MDLHVHRIMGADLSFVTVGLSFTVAKGFSPLKGNAQSYCKVCCSTTSDLSHAVSLPRLCKGEVTVLD